MRSGSIRFRHRFVSPERLRRSALALVVFAWLFMAPPASALVTLDWVTIGNPGNAADPQSSNCIQSNCGSVSTSYRISKFEVTNGQYAEFLNAKAATDSLGLYNTSMGSDATNGGITRSGVSGSYSYTVKTGFADKPVNYVSFYDALRFANWLNNGQASASTEIGAYTLLGGTATPSNGATVSRNAEARIFLTNEHEWYKAAFYNSTSSSYFKYPAGTDATTLCAAPTATANHANCDSAAGGVTAVGAYTGSASPYGTYDQGGNVWEWNEENVSSYRGFRGGTWGGVSSFLAADWTDVMAPETESEYVGFRIARFVPATPSVPIGGVVMPVVAGLLAMTGLVGLAGRPRPLTRDSG